MTSTISFPIFKDQMRLRLTIVNMSACADWMKFILKLNWFRCIQMSTPVNLIAAKPIQLQLTIVLRYALLGLLARNLFGGSRSFPQDGSQPLRTIVSNDHQHTISTISEYPILGYMRAIFSTF